MMQLPFYSSLNEARSAAQQCRACKRFEQRRQVVFGSGNPSAALMLVAEYPSQTDDQSGLPFTGPAGDYLDELLNDAGSSRDEIYITNVVRCYASESGQPGGTIRGSTIRERSACSIWMDLEIQFVDPQVILAIGAAAAASLIGESFRLAEERGSWRRRTDGRLISATMQPAYALRMRTHNPERARNIHTWILDDLRAAVEHARL